MFCTQCGTKLNDNDNFCVNCGAQCKQASPTIAQSAPIAANVPPAPRRLDAMKCARCNSTNIRMQSRVKDGNGIVLGCVMFGGGLGLFLGGIIGVFTGLIFLGIISAAFCAIPSLIIGLIIKAAMPTPTETIAVCQSCGYTSKPIPQIIANKNGHPLFSTESECNLAITRGKSSTGSVIPLHITIDDSPCFAISNDMSVNLKLTPGDHKIFYEQKSGLGKSDRSGFLDVNIERGNKYYLHLLFTHAGLAVKKSW